MTEQYWDHQFTKHGPEKQIGEEKLFSSESSITMRKIMAQPMICVHCHVEFMQGVNGRPAGPCPARNNKSVAKKLGVDLKDIG